MRYFLAVFFLMLLTTTSTVVASANSNCKISIKARASSGQPVSYRVQELEIENNEVKAIFSWQGVIREKFVGELSEDETKYLCKHLSDSDFFTIPTNLEPVSDIYVTGHKAVISLQITINGKHHSVYAPDPSQKKGLAQLGPIWLIAFAEPWNKHMRVKAYTPKKLFRRQPD